jgi:hypothetical protein
MNLAFRLVLFTLFLNLSVGLVSVALDREGTPWYEQPQYFGGLSYDENMTGAFENELQDDVNPSAELESSATTTDRVLDTLNLGLVKKVLLTIDNYLYGFVNLLENVLGRYMDDTMRTFLFGALKTIVTIAYIVGALALWTGKRVDSY